MQKPELTSVIVPVLNEEGHISKLMDTLARQDYPNLEFLLTDGGSSDRTIQLITERQLNDPRFKLIRNPERFVSHGFNLALMEAKGNYIAFLGAHAEYPENYLSQGVKVLDKNIADAVGGPLRHKGLNPTGKAIAFAMTSGFGVGNTAFRTSTERQYVESVAFAVYKKSVFEKLGGMDEALIRNQDDEFHYRMNSAGFKILMIPEMQAVYYVRSSFYALFKQYFQYGLYKPLVLKKVHSGARLRHFIPSLWTLYLVCAVTLSCIFPSGILLCSIPFMLYLMIACYVIFKSPPEINPFLLFLGFSTLHISYGTGFIKGLFLSTTASK